MKLGYFLLASVTPVSYTHLDVYKRQVFGDRVYVYGSHDRVDCERFCDYKLKVWSASWLLYTSMNKVITIGRQYGSGGREIGQKVAEYYGIPFYDNELITRAAKELSLIHI